VESTEYDPRVDRTKLFGAGGEYLGWMDGDPYERRGQENMP
jgi:hypothetical protein